MLVKHSEAQNKERLLMPVGCGVMTGFYNVLVKDISSVEFDDKTLSITEVTLSFGRVYSYHPKNVTKH
jgi:hypothetical protein